MSGLASTVSEQAVHAHAATAPAVLFARILIGAGIMLFSIGMVRAFLRSLGLAASPSDAARPTWGLWHVGGLLVFYIAIDAVVHFVFHPDREDLMQVLVYSTAVFGALALAAVAIAGASGRAGAAAFGLQPRGNVRAILSGVGAYFLSIPCFIGAGLVWSSLLKWIGHDVHPQDLLTEFSGLEAGHRLVPVLIGVLAIPFCEEALFRGFLQPVLVRWWSPWPGIAATAALFGLAHGVDAFFPIFALAMLLGWMKHSTQRLSASYAIHALHNGLTFYVVFHLPKLAEAGPSVGSFHFAP